MEEVQGLAGMEKAGIAGICLAVIWVGYLVFKMFMTQWQKSTEAQNLSTDAVNRNTQSFEKLSAVFEKQHEREIQFQQEVRASLVTMQDTHRKVNEIHGVVIARRRVSDSTSEGDN